MPPPYSKGVRYSKVPQSDPYGYSVAPHPPSAYTPAPSNMQQQSNNTVSVNCYDSFRV